MERDRCHCAVCASVARLQLSFSAHEPLLQVWRFVKRRGKHRVALKLQRDARCQSWTSWPRRGASCRCVCGAPLSFSPQCLPACFQPRCCSYDPVNQLAWFKLYDEVRVLTTQPLAVLLPCYVHAVSRFRCPCSSIAVLCSAAASRTTATRTRRSSTWSGCPRRSSIGESHMDHGTARSLSEGAPHVVALVLRHHTDPTLSPCMVALQVRRRRARRAPAHRDAVGQLLPDRAPPHVNVSPGWHLRAAVLPAPRRQTATRLCGIPSCASLSSSDHPALVLFNPPTPFCKAIATCEHSCVLPPAC